MDNAVRAYLSALGRKGGGKKTAAQSLAHRKAAEKMNASYTAEKRRQAAKKRLETLRKKTSNS